jgi:hypothetical protein
MAFATHLQKTEAELEGLERPQAIDLTAQAAPLLAGLNRFLHPRRLRQYQSAIFDRGHFVIRDPRDGQERICDGTLFAPMKAFAWRFPAPAGDLWLISSGPDRGYEIDGVYDPARRCLALPSGHDSAVAIFLVRHIRAVADAPCGKGQRAKLVLGHPNFAHFLWNEMPALLELESRTASGIAGILLAHEPILPFEKLFDWALAPLVSPITREASHGHRARFHAGALFAAGSTRINLAARERVTQRCRNAAAEVPMPEPGVVRLWLSLRALYRHPVNQIETFVALLRGLSRCGPRFEVLLDGYSLQQDIEVPGRYDIDRERGNRAEVIVMARDLVARCRGWVGGPALIDITGCGIVESIAYAATAQYYICHHGTQQHKIGWLHAVPGLIHASPSIVATQPAGWVADQCEGALLPAYLPNHFVSEAKTENERPGQPYFADYCFNDPKIAADAMIAALRETLNLG